MGQQPDQQYITAVLHGDMNAFSVLIDRYKHMVFTIAIKILRNKEEAEEASQDVFIKAFKGLGSYKGNAAFSTWLYKIAYFHCLDQLKRPQKKMEQAQVPLSEGFSLAAIEERMETLEDTERKDRVANAMNMLSGTDQLILTLYYYEERSLKDIAGIMEISLNSAKVRLFRSRERLAEQLKVQTNHETAN